MCSRSKRGGSGCRKVEGGAWSQRHAYGPRHRLLLTLRIRFGSPDMVCGIGRGGSRVLCDERPEEETRPDDVGGHWTVRSVRCGHWDGATDYVSQAGGEVGTVRDTEVGESRATGSGEDGVSGPATRDIIGVPVQTHAASKARLSNRASLPDCGAKSNASAGALAGRRWGRRRASEATRLRTEGGRSRVGDVQRPR